MNIGEMLFLLFAGVCFVLGCAIPLFYFFLERSRRKARRIGL